MSIPILAVVTDIGRQKLADMLVSGRSFLVEQFTIGSGGHDTGNPIIALTPDPSATALPLQYFGPKLIANAFLFSPTCPQFDCAIAQLEAVGSMSNIGLFARINYSPIPADPLVGTYFLFAVGNFPLRVKTDSESLVISVTIQF